MNAILEQINPIGKSFVEFAFPVLVQSSVLIVILLLVDLALRKRVRAVFRYCIWMLVLVKLVLPSSLSSPLSFGYLFGDRIGNVTVSSTTATAETVEISQPLELSREGEARSVEAISMAPIVTPTTGGIGLAVVEDASSPAVSMVQVTWQGVVFLVWLVVVGAMMLLLLQRALFVRGLVAQARNANSLMNDAFKYCCTQMGMKSEVGLKVSANATSPAVCGLFRPVILVPQNLGPSLGSNHLRTVLLHELAHIKRRDLWVNLAQTVLQIIYFYNPLLWLANAVIRRVREQAVDETVQVAMGERAKQYPETLVNVAKLAFKRPALSLRLIGVVESKSALKGRIKHLLNRPIPRSAKLGLLGLAAVVIIGAVLLPMAAFTPGAPELVIKGMVKNAQTGKPIAGARVFDDGYAHDPDWEKIESGFYEPNLPHWGDVTDANGNYAFLTHAEHHCIKIEATGYKTEDTTLYSGHFTFNKKDEEVFDFELEPLSAGDVMKNSIGMELVYVPAGTFVMGSNLRDNEKSPHQVRLTEGFWIGKYEVTQAQFKRIMGYNRSKFKGLNHPVQGVSWEKAVDFCKKLSEKEGTGYKLPTEAQWEYACRAGTDTPYYFGDDAKRLKKYAWYRDNSNFGKGNETQPVGQKIPNKFGLYDMYGNVWEWCSDWYTDSYKDASAIDPVGPSKSTTYHVLRGGSWYDSAGACRSASRYEYNLPNEFFHVFGFRVVMTEPRLSEAKTINYENEDAVVKAIVEAAFMGPELGSYAASLSNGVTVEDSRNLLMERKDILQKTLQTVEQEYNNGRANSKQLQQAKIDLLRVESELSETPQKRIDILDQIVTLYLEQEKTTKLLLDAGRVTQDELNKVKLLRLDAENELARAKAEGNEQQTDFKGILPNGVTVELVGVCEHPSEGKQWWLPDGRFLSEAANHDLPGRVPLKPGKQAKEIAISFRSTYRKGVHTFFKIEQGLNTTYRTEHTNDKGSDELLRGVAFSTDEDKEFIDIRAGAAAGQWETVSSRSSNKIGRFINGMIHRNIKWDEPYEIDGKTVIFVKSDDVKCDIRIVAVDTNDKMITPILPTSYIFTGEEHLEVKAEFDIPLSDIKKFQYQARTIEWVEFKNVSLRPGVKSDVEIVGGSTERVDYSSVTVTEGVGFDEIIVGDVRCTGKFIKSKLGKPDKEVKNEKDWWLNYRKTYGLDFWVRPKDNVLREIRLNKGFEGKLTSGISMSSAKEDVFNVYGKPIGEETVRDLNKHFENQVLFFRRGTLFGRSKVSKIYYNQHGLLFWFEGDKINQIVIHPKGAKTDVGVGAAAEEKEKVVKKVSGVNITPANFDIRLDEARGVCNLVVSIENQSDVTLPKFKLRFYRGDPANNMDEAGNVHSGWHEAGPIESGKSWNECTRDFHLPDGQYEFHIILDYDDNLVESDETNNRASMGVVVKDGRIIEKSVSYSAQESKGGVRIKPDVEVEVEKATIRVEVITDKPAVVLDLDTGDKMQLDRGGDWPEEYDVAWDNDGGGAIFSKRGGSVTVLPIYGVKDFEDAVRSPFSKTVEPGEEDGYGVFAKDSRYVLVKTSEGNIAVVEIQSYSPARAVLKWQIIKQNPDVEIESAEQIALLRLVELEHRVESAKKLSGLGKALLIYAANDREEKYPDTLQELRPYIGDEQNFEWLLGNVEYLGKGKTLTISPQAVIAYDETLSEKGNGTNVLFNDAHVEFVRPEGLEKLGIKTGQKTDVGVEVRGRPSEDPMTMGRPGAIKRKKEITAKLVTLSEQRDRIQRDLDYAERALQDVRTSWGFTDLEERSYPHPTTSRLIRLEQERDNCHLAIAQLRANVKNLGKREAAEELKNAAILEGKLEALDKMIEEAKAQKRDFDRARVQYKQQTRIRDERQQILDSLKGQIEKLRMVYDEVEASEEQLEVARALTEKEGKDRKGEILAKLRALSEHRNRVQRDLAAAERALQDVRASSGFTDLEERGYPHPITERLMRLELERDNCVLEIAQLKANIENLLKQPDSPEGKEKLKKVKDNLTVLEGKLEALNQMVEEAAVRKRGLDLARVQYKRRARIRDERQRMLDSLKSQIEQLRIVYDEAEVASRKEKSKTARTLKIVVYGNSSSEPEVTLKIPLTGLKIANSLLPPKVKEQMATQGIDLAKILEGFEDGLEAMTLLDVKEKDERVIISLE